MTTQFAASGLNFVTLSGAGITLVDNAACTNTGVGVSGRYLYMGVSPGPSGSCFTNATSDAVSIQFANDVSELSWRGFIISPNFTIQALNNGIVVSQTVFNTQVYISGGTPVLFSGSVFDEIRFIENGSAGQYFAVDNMRWTDAAAAPVPEPTSLLLLGTGVFGLMAKARRRRKDPTV